MENLYKSILFLVSIPFWILFPRQRNRKVDFDRISGYGITPDGVELVMTHKVDGDHWEPMYEGYW